MVRAFVATLLLSTYFLPSVGAESIQDLTKTIRAVEVNGQGHPAAIAAWKELSQAPADQLPVVLAGMDGANKLAVNWLRAAADTIAQRQIRAGQKLPIEGLEAFIADHDHHPRARRTAYELILLVDQTAKQRIIPQLLNDPSLELRRDAVADLLQKAAALQAKDEASAAFRKALSSARDLDQIDLATDKLREAGETVDLPVHFGFLMKWDLVGPFDNSEKKGFDVAYPPEKAVDLTASYDGKDGEVKWFQYATTNEYGVVDLNEVLDKHKGAIVYAHASYVADEARPIEIRLGCINGNKIWLNGKLLTQNHVYHASTSIDQYIAAGTLKAGVNHILIKVAQNEQTDSWAQRWQFQLRVCDQYGTAVLGSNR
jgi:hypothetical protein